MVVMMIRPNAESNSSAAEANALLLDKDWSLSSATNAGTPRDEWTGFTLKFDLDTDLQGVVIQPQVFHQTKVQI